MIYDMKEYIFFLKIPQGRWVSKMLWRHVVFS